MSYLIRRRGYMSRSFCAFVCTGAAAVIFTGCGSEKHSPKGNKAEVAEHAAHDHHDHDTTPGHSHEDGHAHDHEEDHDHEDGHNHEDHDHDHAAEPAEIPIPAMVRENLGITFARAELRRVASTIRVPGRFEPLPSALREYHAPLAGRVELLVRQYDRVTTGTPLYKLDSAEWRRMQQELLTVEAEVAATSATLMTAQVAREGGEAAEGVTRQRIDAADDHIANLAHSVKLAEDREKQVLRLQEVVGGRMSDLNEARSQLASLRNELSQAREDRAELEQQRLQLSTDAGGGAFGTTETLKASLSARLTEYESARARRDLLRASLISITGTQNSATHDDPITWTGMPDIIIRAATGGIVSAVSVTSGGYVDSSAQVLSTIDPTILRFRAVALQSDITKLNQEMAGRVLAPAGSAGSIPVTATLALEADPQARTLDVVADVPATSPWVKPGVSTDLELVLDMSAFPHPAIPVAAIIQDGLEKVFFKRDSHNPDAAIRIHAELGTSDGHWIAVKDGVNAGDEVVVGGAYELKLATAAATAKAGHFHADGTFHEGKD